MVPVNIRTMPGQTVDVTMVDVTMVDVTMVDVTVPVYNEEHVLRLSIERLHAYLTESFPFGWQITIADNASTDGTRAIAHQLASELSSVRVVEIDRKGRGLALRTAWSSSTAEIVAYMDVDLSTGVNALLPLVASVHSGHSELWTVGRRNDVHLIKISAVIDHFQTLTTVHRNRAVNAHNEPA